MAHEIETIKKKRHIAEMAVTLISHSLDQSDSLSKKDLQIRLDELEHSFSEFDSADAELPEEMSDIADFENKYFEIKAKILTRIENLKHCVNIQKGHINDSDTAFQAGRNSNGHSNQTPIEDGKRTPHVFPALRVNAAACNKSLPLLCTSRVAASPSEKVTDRAVFDSEAVGENFLKPREDAGYQISYLLDTKIGFSESIADLVIRSENNIDEMKISALIPIKLHGSLPSQELKLAYLSHLGNFKFADPYFNVPGEIDVIIDADYFGFTSLLGQTVDSNCKTIAQNSVFGFLISIKLPGELFNLDTAFIINKNNAKTDDEFNLFCKTEKTFKSTADLSSCEVQVCKTPHINFGDFQTASKSLNTNELELKTNLPISTKGFPVSHVASLFENSVLRVGAQDRNSSQKLQWNPPTRFVVNHQPSFLPTLDIRMSQLYFATHLLFIVFYSSKCKSMNTRLKMDNYLPDIT